MYALGSVQLIVCLAVSWRRSNEPSKGTARTIEQNNNAESDDKYRGVPILGECA